MRRLSDMTVLLSIKGNVLSIVYPPPQGLPGPQGAIGPPGEKVPYHMIAYCICNVSCSLLHIICRSTGEIKCRVDKMLINAEAESLKLQEIVWFICMCRKWSCYLSQFRMLFILLYTPISNVCPNIAESTVQQIHNLDTF